VKKLKGAALIILLLVLPAISFSDMCGDVNADLTVNIFDINYLISYLYEGGPAPDCDSSGYYYNCADVNYDSLINLQDITYIISYLYLEGPEPDCGTTGIMTDIDDNQYQTIKIGNQWWMAENLKVTRYRNGSSIPNVTDSATWDTITTGAYCEYNNDSSLVSIYGRLYNWYTTVDSNILAPAGWHVPSDSEWQVLEIYLGMDSADAYAGGWRGTDEGGKLKEADTAHWDSPNTGATNESGFTALPAGYRFETGKYDNIYLTALFRTITEYGSGTAGRNLSRVHSDIYRDWYYDNYGMSVRCVKD